MFYKEVVEANSKYNTDNICNYLNDAVKEVLKYYNKEFADSVCDLIYSLKDKLNNNGFNTLLEYIEERIRIIENIEDSACINIILEYIDSLIDWSWFEDIR